MLDVAYLCLEANYSAIPLVSGGTRTDRPSIIDVKWLSLTAMRCLSHVLSVFVS